MKELYRRYLSTSVKGVPERRARAHTILCDTFQEAYLDMEVERDTARILAISGEMNRAPHYETCSRTVARLEQLVGITAGQGCGRLVRDALSGPGGCTRLEEMLFFTIENFMDGNDMLNGFERPPEEKTPEAALARLDETRFKDICNAWSFWDDPEYPVLPPVPFPAEEGFHRFVSSCVRLNGIDSLWVEASMNDSVHELRIELEVELPSRKITRIEGEFIREPHGRWCIETGQKLQGLVGWQAWPGQTRQIRQVVGGGRGCSRYEVLCIEAFRAVLQAHFPLLERQHPQDPRLGRQTMFGYLKDSCLAYTELKADPEWNAEAAKPGGDSN